MDITYYFRPSEGDKLGGRGLKSTKPKASQTSILRIVT